MLSMLTVYKISPDLRPEPGFFNLAREVGYNLPYRKGEDVFWIKQSKKVYDQWGRRRRQRGWRSRRLPAHHKNAPPLPGISCL